MPDLTRRTRGRRGLAIAALTAIVATGAGCGGDDDDPPATTAAAAAAETTASAASSAAAPEASTTAEPTAAEATSEAATDAGATKFAGVKAYLADQTAQLVAFTEEFKADSEQYAALAEKSGNDPAKLWADDAAEVGPLVQKLKASWVEGNPLYERMEGIVAGVPSLSQYDVIIDAGSSVQDDPESAVPFDLTLPDGTVLKQPGAFYNITEGMLWGTLPDYQPQSTPADLDGNGTEDFGEVLPDPGFLLVAATDFDKYAKELQTAAAAWEPTDSDAFTSLVVMVPTMSEYFGQWKESRFVLGDQATAENFNVVSRLSDIHDILASLQVVYDDVHPVIAASDTAQADQTAGELDGLQGFIDDLWKKEQDGTRFTPDEAEVLGKEAQTRGAAIAGQVSQAASALGISVIE